MLLVLLKYVIFYIIFYTFHCNFSQLFLPFHSYSKPKHPKLSISSFFELHYWLLSYLNKLKKSFEIKKIFICFSSEPTNNIAPKALNEKFGFNILNSAELQPCIITCPVVGFPVPFYRWVIFHRLFTLFW